MAQVSTFFASDNLSNEELNTLPVEKMMTHVGFLRAFPIQSLLPSETYDDKGTAVKSLPGLIKSEEIDDVKFRHYEREQSPYGFSVSTSIAAFSIALTTITLHSTTGLRDEDIIQIGAVVSDSVASLVPIQFVVEDIVSATEITIKAISTTASDFSLNAGCPVTIIASAFAPGMDMRVYSAPEAYSVEQYLQQYKETIAMDFTILKQGTKLGENRWPEEMDYGMVRFKQERESSIWFSELSSFTNVNHTSHTARTTQGIIPYIASDTDRITDWGTWGTWSKNEFIDTMIPVIFSDGSGEKYLFSSDKLMAGMTDSFKDNFLEMTPTDKEYNIVVTNVVTPWGTLKLAMNGLFGRYYGKSNEAFGVALQINLLKYKHLKDRDTHLREIPSTGPQVKELEICSESGLRIGYRNAHTIIGNIKMGTV